MTDKSKLEKHDELKVINKTEDSDLSYSWASIILEDALKNIKSIELKEKINK